MTLWDRLAQIGFARADRSNRNRNIERKLSLGFHLLEQRALMSLESLQPQTAADYVDEYLSVAAAWFEQLSLSSAARVASGGFTLEQATGKVRWQSQLVDVFSDEWIVQLTPSAASSIQSVSQVASLFAPEGLQFEVIGGLGLVGQVLVRVSGAAFDDVAAWLSANPNVAYCEPNVVMPLSALPSDPQFNLLWGLHNTGQTIGNQAGTVDADIDAPEAWQITTGSSRIVVAVIDTGVDYTHPDLAQNIWRNTGEVPGNGIDDDGNGFIDDYYGWDFANGDNNPFDDHGHGTHVAGIIGAVGNNGLGVTGGAWSVSIMPIKFLSANGSGSLDNAIRAINYVTMMRSRFGVDVRVSNNSWGGGSFYQSLYDAIAAHNRAGIMFVAAAGNNGRNTDLTPNYPSCYALENVISVAATDNRDNLAVFSNYGATSVDLAAPGVNIYSTKPGGGYQYLSGTSMAAPYVSAVAALAWSVAPNATVAEIRNALLAGVDRKPSLAGKVASGGRLNARGTLEMLNMSVAGSLPVAGTSVSVRPVEFTVTFSQPYDPGSVQPSDFTVNGIPADSVVLLTANSVRFRYNISPVRADGLQTMQIAEGAIRGLSGSPLRAWEAQFFYDSVPTTVVSSSPANGAVLAAAPQYITLTFNEALAAATIGADDLALSAGRVTAAALLSPTVVRYTVDLYGVNGAVTYALRAGAVTDVHGNPGPSYTGSFTINDPAVVRYQATDTPKPLVDYGTVVSYLNIADNRIITDVDVELNITHTWVADLNISLVAPNGRVVRLVSRAGNGANFAATTFDDQANTPISAGSVPFTGRFRPLDPLSTLNGMSTQGTWRLVVTDTDPWDTGTLSSWALVLRTAAVNNPPVLAPIPNQTNIGRPWSVVLRASDPDGDTLTFSAVARAVGSTAPVPVTLSINQQTRIVSINPNGYRGAFEVEVRASDGRAVTVQRFRVNAPTSVAVRSLASLGSGLGGSGSVCASALDELAARGQLPTTPAAQLAESTVAALERAHALAQLDPRWVLFAQEQWHNSTGSQLSPLRRDRPAAQIF